MPRREDDSAARKVKLPQCEGVRCQVSDIRTQISDLRSQVKLNSAVYIFARLNMIGPIESRIYFGSTQESHLHCAEALEVLLVVVIADLATCI